MTVTDRIIVDDVDASLTPWFWLATEMEATMYEASVQKLSYTEY